MTDMRFFYLGSVMANTELLAIILNYKSLGTNLFSFIALVMAFTKSHNKVLSFTDRISGLTVHIIF